jgi:hypothetical protein
MQKDFKDFKKDIIDDITELKVYTYKKIKGQRQSTELQIYNNRLSFFANKIKNNEPFIIVKYGDGEWLSMISNDESEYNCDSCHYFKELGYNLIRSYIYFLKNDNVFICRWPFTTYDMQTQIENDFKDNFNESKFLYYDTLIHKLDKTNSFDNELVDFFKIIKNSSLKKIYISNSKMASAVKDILNIVVNINVPEIDSYLQKDSIYKQLYNELYKTKEPCILLFSAGFLSKILIAWLSHEWPNNIFLDIGSTFDGLIKASRDFNKDPEYKSIMTATYMRL